ncbi:MAG: acyltransferase family protein [Bacilli bacterium]
MKTRYHSLSVYRLIATICILQFHIFFLVHNYDIPYEMLLSKGVQGLTALSGFLYARKVITNNKEFIKTNFKKLIIPVLVCFSLISFYYIIYSLFNNISFIDCFISFRPFNNVKIFSFANLYYIAYIGICYLITPLLKKNKKVKIIVSSLVFFLDIVLSYFTSIAIIVSCYIVGYLVGEKYFDTYVNKDYKKKIPHIVIWSILIIVSLGVYALTIRAANENFFLDQLLSIADIVASTTFGTATFFLFILLFAFLNNTKNYKFLMFSDKLCYYIYILNQVFMSGAANISLLSDNYFIKYVLIYVITIAVSYLCYLINKKVEKGKYLRLFKLN